MGNLSLQQPNPGSDAAVNAGCKCPVMDNSYGRGYYQQPGVFVFTDAIRDGCLIAAVTFLALGVLYIFIWDWGYRE